MICRFFLTFSAWLNHGYNTLPNKVRDISVTDIASYGRRVTDETPAFHKQRFVTDHRRNVAALCVGWSWRALNDQPIRLLQCRTWRATWPTWWIVAIVAMVNSQQRCVWFLQRCRMLLFRSFDGDVAIFSERKFIAEKWRRANWCKLFCFHMFALCNNVTIVRC